MNALKFTRSRFLLWGLPLLGAVVLAGFLVSNHFGSLFSSGFFMPHRHCYLDNPSMLWLQGLSDFLIGASYMLIATVLAYLVYRARNNIPFTWMFLAFGLFIFSCGWTHFMEVWTLWYPTYWLSGSIKAITAAASIATAFGIVYLLPHVFGLIHLSQVSEQRRRELVKAHADLQRAYKELEVFSYSLSHDMRAPLRAVHAYTSIVLEDHRQTLGSDATQHLEKVIGASQRMERLVSDVLALSRVSLGELHRQPVDIEPLASQIIEDRPELQSPRAEVLIQSPLLPVLGDATSLTQCLANLLTNAAKFVPPGVQPRVRISTERRGDKVRLWVADNGIGIPPEWQQRVFEPFQRLHPLEEYEGSGIGLAIVHKAVQRMGGEAGVESEPQHGSRFWIELSAADTP